jgi:bifunctional non-homologous end joining protein LigD
VRPSTFAQLLAERKTGILLNEHIVEDGATVFAHACQLGAEGIVSKKIDGTYRSGPSRVFVKARNPASIAGCSESGARFGTGERRYGP